MQIRYRYEIGPLSEVFIVYGRGGEAEKEGNDHSNNISYFNPKSSKDSEKVEIEVVTVREVNAYTATGAEYEAPEAE